MLQEGTSVSALQQVTLLRLTSFLWQRTCQSTVRQRTTQARSYISTRLVPDDDDDEPRLWQSTRARKLPYRQVEGRHSVCAGVSMQCVSERGRNDKAPSPERANASCDGMPRLDNGALLVVMQDLRRDFKHGSKDVQLDKVGHVFCAISRTASRPQSRASERETSSERGCGGGRIRAA